MSFPSYTTFQEKKDLLNYHGKILTENELSEFLKSIKNGKYIFRGINNASFKMLSSCQRNWISNSEIVRYHNAPDFTSFVESLIAKVRKNANFIGFCNKHSLPVNDFLVLAALQHYPNISPLIDFSESVKAALFFAVDKTSPINGDDSLNNYISIYFLPTDNEYIRSSIQNINAIGMKNMENMVIETMKKILS